MQWAETMPQNPKWKGPSEPPGALGVRILLVGQEDAVRRELALYDDWRSLPIEVVHASERITMDDSAARAVRVKRDSSMRVASRLVRDGVAQGFVSAGNTGAVMATAKMVQGVVPGVARPALALVLPTLVKDSPVVVVDVGANVDCSPRMLAQFAVMGETYSRIILGRNKPRVAHSLDRRRRPQRQRSYPLGCSPAQEPQSELYRQCRRPRHLRRPGGRGSLRWVHRECGAQGQ